MDLKAAAAQLKSTIGVVEHGLFYGMTSEVIVASQSKGVYVLRPEGAGQHSAPHRMPKRAASPCVPATRANQL